MKRILTILCIGLMLAACVKKAPAPQEVVVDPADRALAKAAAEIQRDLRMLAESDYEGPLPAESQSLAGMANYRFTGEIEDIVRDVGRNIGYNVDFNGRVPPGAIVVAIHSTEPMSWFNILQSAGVQAGDRANITVNDATKTITLSYDGIDLNAPKRIRENHPARSQVERNNPIVQASRGDQARYQKSQARLVSAQTQTAADQGPRTIQASSLMVGRPEYAQGSPGVFNQPVAQGQNPYTGPNLGVQEPISQPAAQVPQRGFHYSGSVLGAQSLLSQRLGYQPRIDGPARDMPVNVASQSGAWQDVANSINQQLKDASIFVDPANKLVVLRFWR